MTSARRFAAAAATAIIACLLLAGFAGARGSRPATDLSVSVVRSVSKPKASRRKSSSARRAECAAAARTEKARKACAVEKAKVRAKKPSVSRGPLGSSLSPAFTSPGVQEAALERANGKASPAQAPEPTDPEGSGSSSKPLGGSGSSPVETPTVEASPVEAPPIETSPVETPLVGPPIETPLVETPSVNESLTTTTLASSANPSTVGQGVTYTATISALAATGTVEFKDGDVVISGCADRAVSFSIATCTLGGYATTGTHSITATYSGDGNYLSSTSSTLTQTILSADQGADQTVSKNATTTTLSSSSDPSTVGQSVAFTATMSSAVATGTVEFRQAGAAIAGCSTQLVSSGTATCTVTNLAAGGHWITAVYSGDSSYGSSTSPGLTQTVNKKTTTTAVSSSLDPSTVGQPVIYTAMVGPAAATGTVSFDEDGKPIEGCAAQVISAGTATCTLSNLVAGGHWITAVYSGDSSYGSSTSPGLTQTVNKKTTTTAVSSSLDPSTVGQAVIYTATVSAAAATGTVSFDEAGTPITGCTAQPVSSGTAMCTMTDLAAGGRWVTAVYSGDSNYAASSSSGLTQTVSKKTTTTTVSSSLDPSTVGQAVTFTATVSAAVATGTVAFKQAGVAIAGCAAQPASSGTATCTVADLAAGGYWITAVYSGDSSYGSSTSPGLTQTVKKKTTTTSVSSSVNPSTVGEAVTLTAMVSSGVATGTVEFEQAGVTIGGCSAQAVSSGTATCTVANLAAGGHWITAVYSGDSSYGSSTSPGLTQTVKKKTTTTSVSSSVNPSTVGEAVTYTATVSPATATGTVEFKEEITPITGCSAEIISSGTATCTVTSYPKWSSYEITADYSGDSSDLASASSTFTQMVEPPTESAAPFRFFSPTSFWNEEVPASASLDPSSAGVVTAFDREIAAAEAAKTGLPNINTTSWSVPVYTVPADQPLVKVTLEEGSRWTAALQSAWDAVPLPAHAQPAVGTDKMLVVWQPSTDKLWEFWRLEETLTGWQATWGGAMQNASADSGAYGPEDWSGAKSNWGAAATSLSVAGGLITLEDLEKGQIDHALAISIPTSRGGVYAAPAERTDGSSTEPLSIPEGAHLRLDPSLDLASLHLPKLTLMMAEAAQRYGIFVVNQSVNVAMYAQDPIPIGANPYTGAHGYYEGKSAQAILEAFPWSHLQLLKMELHSTS
jgi:hypothetical protein